MRELSISEIERVNGGFEPLEVALGIGFIGLTISYVSFSAKAAFTSAASVGATSPFAMGGAALVLYSAGAFLGVGAAVAVGGMLVMAYTSQQGDGYGQPMLGHSCGA